MTPLWTETDAAEATRGRATRPFNASGVSIDTRSLSPGDLFVALRGENNDGHDHLAKAASAGASAAIVDIIPDGAPEDLPYLIVNDTLAALRDLAVSARARLKGKVIGVTGSVGKTGAKDALAHLLQTFGTVHKTIGNLNNHFGCPLTLSRMPANTDFAIIEMGMNHAGEISPLSTLAKPDVALITTVDAVHLEFFESVEGIADAKSEIFDGLVKNGTAVLNRDNPYFARMLGNAEKRGVANITTFGEHGDADHRLTGFKPNDSGSSITAICGDTTVSYELAVTGRHLALNSLGILAVIDALGVDIEKASKLFASLISNPGRGGRVEVRVADGSFILIDESYNASPASTKAALQVLSVAPVGGGGRRIAVLGDMLELGDQGPQLHIDLADTIASSDIDLVFTAGPLMMGLFEALPKNKKGGHASSSAEILPLVTATVRSGDVVSVKGSLGSRMKPVVDALSALGRSGHHDEDKDTSISLNGGCG